ncbi:MAG: cell division protein FtsW [Ruminobacter sp.]|uniref:Probable peptidoglycan glycosyltransferase FtsW n=1 Tax=Ruminobacter amylophilus TaxID=867 RepID=A0A662ZIK1_9GAMM|nr:MULTISPECIES: putative peptidoglycan glycosyltransferase FtsW [Ruminobacter]MBQ3774643.1 cell division protein FtsW [Ruminobacter sp.]SFP35210.1 cell division protein FtsW [Ruminobacter amylophilus]
MSFWARLLGNSDKKYRLNGVMFDTWYIVLPAILTVIGLIAIYSSSIYVSVDKFGTDSHYLLKQLGFCFGSFVLYMMLLNVSTKQWYELGRFKIVSLVIVLSLLVVFVGRDINGAKRWLSLGFCNIQPSEFMKLALILFVSGYIHRHYDEIRRFKCNLLISIPFLLFVAILYLQRDMGTMVIIAIILGVILFISGMQWKYIFPVCILGLLGVLWLIQDPYRMGKIVSFQDPFVTRTGTGFQLSMSLIAIAKGGLWGQGLGNSEIKLSYIPEPHTDFIMSIVSEECGFISVLVIFALELMLIVRSFFMGFEALRSKTDCNYFQGFCAIGIATWFGVQCIINMGVICALFPTKGLTMPFISYGGTSLISSVIAVCILLRISYERKLSYVNRIRKAQIRYKQVNKRVRAENKDGAQNV